MCIVFFDLQPEGGEHGYQLIVAANRDEFLQRPTAKAHHWADAPHVIAGRDLQAGSTEGTWFGVTTTGRIAFLTNYRQPAKDINPTAKSRGELTKAFLTGTMSPEVFAQSLQGELGDYNGFNLVVGTLNGSPELWYISNMTPHEERTEACTRIPNGLHGLCNHLLNTPWPKIKRGKQRVVEVLQQQQQCDASRDSLCVALVDVLRDNQKFADDELPDTGVPVAWERALSPIFVQHEEPPYATRAHTLLLVGNDGRVTFVEHALEKDSQEWTETRFEFKL
eukprot:m.6147 g.6147  ORF g.6147 m.6147 type:complete len:279 (-) comp2555_c1_seq1:52-888(-)